MVSQNELIKQLAVENGVCIVKFETKTCANCKFWDKIIDGVFKSIGKTVEVKHIDVDEHKDYAEVFNIIELPYIVIADDGNQVREFVGKPTKADKEALEEVLKKYAV